MGFEIVPRCEECSRLQDRINHWFIVMLVDSKLIFDQLSTLNGEASDHWKPLCGQGCASKVFSRWLDTGQIEKPEVQHPEESVILPPLEGNSN